MATIYGYGVDVASYQPQAVTSSFYTNLGVSYAVVKVSESTSSTNPYSSQQVSAAKAAGIPVHAYHYAHFGGSVSGAVTEANAAVSFANKAGIPQGGILALDYEVRGGTADSNHAAIVQFLNIVKNAGFRPAFYSGPSMASMFNADRIFNDTGATLWVAAYPLGSGAASLPLFNYFPSISNHTSAWQFTDNYKGAHVDGSADLLGIWCRQSDNTPDPTPTPDPDPTPTPDPDPTPAPQPVPTVPQVVVDGYAGQATVKRLQSVLGTPQDGFISGQSVNNRSFVCAFTAIQWGTGGSQLVVKLQQQLGVTADGYLGQATVKAWQQRLGVNPDGYAGKETVRAMQTKLNQNVLY